MGGLFGGKPDDSAQKEQMRLQGIQARRLANKERDQLKDKVARDKLRPNEGENKSTLYASHLGVPTSTS
jgi:hypothetical protein